MSQPAVDQKMPCTQLSLHSVAINGIIIQNSILWDALSCQIGICAGGCSEGLNYCANQFTWKLIDRDSFAHSHPRNSLGKCHRKEGTDFPRFSPSTLMIFRNSQGGGGRGRISRLFVSLSWPTFVIRGATEGLVANVKNKPPSPRGTLLFRGSHRPRGRCCFSSTVVVHHCSREMMCLGVEYTKLWVPSRSPWGLAADFPPLYLPIYPVGFPLRSSGFIPAPRPFKHNFGGSDFVFRQASGGVGGGARSEEATPQRQSTLFAKQPTEHVGVAVPPPLCRRHRQQQFERLNDGTETVICQTN